MNRSRIFAEFLEDVGVMRRALFSKVVGTVARKGLPTPAQLGVLAAIVQDGPQGIKELAGRFGMSSSAATQLVNGLVRAKLLTRNKDQNDRRRACVALTAEGSERLQKAKRCQAEALERLLSALTDREIEQLHKMQQKILTHLS